MPNTIDQLDAGFTWLGRALKAGLVAVVGYAVAAALMGEHAAVRVLAGLVAIVVWNAWLDRRKQRAARPAAAEPPALRDLTFLDPDA